MRRWSVRSSGRRSKNTITIISFRVSPVFDSKLWEKMSVDIFVAKPDRYIEYRDLRAATDREYGLSRERQEKISFASNSLGSWRLRSESLKSFF